MIEVNAREPGEVRRAARSASPRSRISSKTGALLGWDQQVMMPPRGAPMRAEQLATVGRIAHQKFTSPEVGKLIDDLRSWGEQHEYDSFEASLIRVAARDWEKASKVPSELRAEMSRSAALANPVWVDARKRERLRGVPAGAAQEPRPPQALHRLLRRRRRAVRHRPRRLRARHEDEGGACASSTT